MQQSEKEPEAQKLENLSIQVQAMNENFDRLFKVLEQHGVPGISKETSLDSTDATSDVFTSAPSAIIKSNGQVTPVKDGLAGLKDGLKGVQPRKKSVGNVDFFEAKLANPTASRRSIMRSYTSTIDEEEEEMIGAEGLKETAKMMRQQSTKSLPN